MRFPYNLVPSIPQLCHEFSVVWFGMSGLVSLLCWPLVLVPPDGASFLGLALLLIQLLNAPIIFVEAIGLRRRFRQALAGTQAGELRYDSELWRKVSRASWPRATLLGIMATLCLVCAAHVGVVGFDGLAHSNGSPLDYLFIGGTAALAINALLLIFGARTLLPSHRDRGGRIVFLGKRDAGSPAVLLVPGAFQILGQLQGASIGQVPVEGHLMLNLWGGLAGTVDSPASDVKWVCPIPKDQIDAATRIVEALGRRPT